MSDVPKLIGEGDGPIPEEPDSLTAPQHINTTRRIGDKLYVAGSGPKPARLMLIATSLTEDECAEQQIMIYGKALSQKPCVLKGAAGAILKDIMGGCQIDIQDCYYTALVKYLLPKQHRTKPKKEDIAWSAPALFNEIKEVNPDIIICLGKPVFDLLAELSVKIPMRDIHGAWFDCPRFGCRLFPMEDVTKPVFKPEYVEKNRVELTMVKQALDQIEGIGRPRVKTDYRIVANFAELTAMVAEWDAGNFKVFAVDCEWGGNNHVTGQLRSIQFCWADGVGAYVRFRDEKGEYVFDTDYKQAGALLACHLNRPDVKYVGHHIAADFPWMFQWLGLDWYDKCIMDTEFGQQCVDEFEDLGLERMAILYTDLGRYDLELMLWYKANKQPPEAGYAYIPDRIIIPYAIADVDATFRAYPNILRQLTQQKLLEYFYGIFLPFVSNVFTQFSLTGLPMNRAKMDELRELFSFAKEQMEIQLRRHIHEEADQIMFSKMMQVNPNQAPESFVQIRELLADGDFTEAFNVFKHCVGVTKLQDLQAVFDHRLVAPNFNIRSVDQMRRWLFEVKGFEPIKTTNNKEAGLPSMPWYKVLAMPPDRQKEFKPSTDKQTLQILGDQDKIIGELLELNAVGNLCKAFLKEPVLDDETGEITKENGLHFWLCTDDRIHGQMSTTETGRPRAWKPNSLNWPSFVNAKISDGILKLMERLKATNQLPDRFDRYLEEGVPSIRSCVDVSSIPKLPGSEGWCFVESDYKTAEVRGLAYISGDPTMIKMFEEPDEQFGLLRVGDTGSDEDDLLPVRLNYAPDCGINPEGQDGRVIGRKVSRRKVADLHKGKQIPEGQTEREFAEVVLEELVTAGVAIRIDEKDYFFLDPVSESELERNEDGSLRHPDFDFHWNLAEMVNHKPREFMSKKIERGAGKVGNFSSAYGATPDTLERKIEADTGTKPPEGTGQELLDALDRRQPIAMGFLKSMEDVPKNPGYYRAASGRIRHFYLHPDNLYQIGSRASRGMVSAMGRECRNYPFQESVAATSARAGNGLLKHFREAGMYALPMVILYDSVVTLCPIEERHEVAELHTRYMCDENTWNYSGRELKYPIDTEFNLAWSTKPDEDIRLKLYDRNWASDRSRVG